MIEAEKPDLPDRITSQADLHALWCGLMGPLGFSRRTLWLVFVTADGTPIPQIMPVDDIPQTPEREEIDRLMALCAHVLRDTGDRLAVLHSRPGRGPLTALDRAWARELVAAAEAARVPLLPLHRANDDNLLVVAADDLVRSA